jgi:hypothetical protein
MRYFSVDWTRRLAEPLLDFVEFPDGLRACRAWSQPPQCGQSRVFAPRLQAHSRYHPFPEADARRQPDSSQFLLQRALAAFFAETDRCFFGHIFRAGLAALEAAAPSQFDGGGIFVRH